MRGARMGLNQLLDSLTDHLALYHRKIGRSRSDVHTRGSPREKVLEWLRGLSIDQRQATLTITDRNWVSILLQMQKRLEREGAGYFFVLTDVLEFEPLNVVKEDSSTSRKSISKPEQELDLRKPQKSRKSRKRMAIQTFSTSSKSCPDAATGLPGLCFRKAKGLLARLDEQQVAGELLARNLELFSSGEDEDHHFLDTLSVSENLMTNLEQFLAILDVITYGEFLTSVSGRGSSSWEEMPWLKAMGYYTLPAFVANKLELSLWSAWLQSEGAKRLPRTLTKELRMTGWNLRTCPSDASSLIICKRNKGFSGWWTNLTKDMKSSALRYAVARAAKVEVMQTMRASCSSASVGRQQNAKASTAQGRLVRRSYSVDLDSEHWGGAQLVEKKGAFWSYVSGLDALRKITASTLPLAFSEGADLNKSNELSWLFHSHLLSVDALPGRVMQRVRTALRKVMLQSTELELLRSESCRSQAACSQSKDIEGKLKKENRKKKIQNSAQSKELPKSGNEFLSEKQLENHVSQATASSIGVREEHMNNEIKQEQNEHDRGMKLGPVNRKQSLKSADRKQGKKKKQGRAKLKAASENCLNMSGYEEMNESSCTLNKERKVETEVSSGALVYNDNTVDSGIGGLSSPELVDPGNRILLCAELQNTASHSEHLGLMENEHSSLRIVEDDFPSTTDSHGSTNVTNHDSCTGLSKPLDLLSLQDLHKEIMQTELSIERKTPTGTPSDLPLLTAICSGTEGICNEANSHVSEKVDAESCRVVCGLKSLRKVYKALDLAEGQCVLPPADNRSIPGILSRSSCSSPTTSDIYSHTERLKPYMLHSHKNSAFGLPTPHEWPGTNQVRFPGVRSHVMPPATERLHLDVGRNWQRLQASLMTLRSPVMIQQPNSGSNSKRISGIQNSFKSPDCPPMFPTGYNFTQTRGFPFGFREEPGFIPLSQPYSFGADFNVFTRSQDESKHDDKTPEDTDYDDSNYFSGDLDEHEGFRISEEEGERQFLDLNLHRKGDYNQFFGGGVMYWNTPDYAGMGYSRPPSLSSEDSSWARHEADLSVVLDDSTGLSPMSGTFANGASPSLVSTSPPTASYHSGFDPNAVSTTPRMGLPTSGNEFPGKFPPLPSTVVSAKPEDEQNKGPNGVATISVLEGLAIDIVPRPLRPIIVVRDPSLSRQVSVSESLRRREARSPHVPCGRREMPRRRRPPSPVLRCVPPAPPPPPPSPVGGFGKRKGMTTVRSGSSSPRRWSLANYCHKEELDAPLVISGLLEAATNSWRSRSMTDRSPLHSISGTLFRERLVAVPPLTLEQEHPDVSLPMQTTLLFNSNPSLQSAITILHSTLHEEIEGFCNQVVAENLLRKPFITMAVDKVAHALQVLWPRSRVRIFGSNATGLALPCSDVDLVVCLPPVRNLEPIKEAGILEGRNGIKETCLQHAARYLADQDWVKGDTLKTIENTAIPIIMLVAHVASQLCNPTEGGDSENFMLKPHLKDTRMVHGRVSIDANGQSATNFHSNIVSIPSSQPSLSEDRQGPWGGNADREFVRLDISFEAPSHTGIQTAKLVQDLTAQFPAIVPLALVLKQFLTDRSLDHPYTGGLSSYCLVLLITRFLQHQHHLGWPFQQNLGSLLMDFLHFFGCVFDPRRMGVCIRGGGMYVKRDRGHSIDPLHIEDPLHLSNNVGRNCFRILQCVKVCFVCQTLFSSYCQGGALCFGMYSLMGRNVLVSTIAEVVFLWSQEQLGHPYLLHTEKL